MLTLKYLREGNDNLLSLGISEGEETARYTVRREIYSNIGSPAVGDEITPDALDAIKSDGLYLSAKKKALSLLSYADNNRSALYQKLRRAGFSDALSREIVSEMVDYGYINERRQIERRILAEANQKLRGPIRIKQLLASLGFSASEISEELNLLCDSGEIDFEENKKRLIEKKLPTDPTEEQIKALLYKNGYKV